jgi:hypothetical protein
MSTNPVPMAPGAIQTLVDAIERAVQSGANIVNAIIDRVVDFLDWLPGFIANRVVPWLRRLATTVQGFLAKVLEFLEGAAFPVFAFLKANSWNDEVRNPVNKVAGELSDGALHVGDYWQGPASIAYTNALVAQTKGYTEVGAIVDDLKIRLWAVAGLIVGFYVALAAIIAQWLGVMTASAAATATGVGAIAGVPAAVAATGITAGAVLALASTIAALIAAEMESFTRLNHRITSSAALPAGSWPKPTSAGTLLSDGSISDPDGQTEWQLRR